MSSVVPGNVRQKSFSEAGDPRRTAAERAFSRDFLVAFFVVCFLIGITHRRAKAAPRRPAYIPGMAKKAVFPGTSRTFKSVLRPEGPKGAWTFMSIPFDTVKMFGTKGRISVVITFGKTEFRSSIFPNGEGLHHMMVNKKMQAAAGAEAGDTVTCRMRADTAERTVVVPPELRKALASDKSAKAAFDAYSWSHRKEYCDYIAEAKQAATRERRAARTVECILEKKRVR